MDELLGEYERLRRELSAARERMRTISGTGSSSDRSVTVRVDSAARLVGVEIDARAYRRFSPSQLAQEILRCGREATRDARRQAADVMAPFLPAGVGYEDLVSGEAEVASWAPPQPLDDESFDAWRARFSGRPDAGASGTGTV